MFVLCSYISVERYRSKKWWRRFDYNTTLLERGISPSFDPKQNESIDSFEAYFTQTRSNRTYQHLQIPYQLPQAPEATRLQRWTEGFRAFPQRSEVLFFPPHSSFQISALSVLWPNLLGGSTVAFLLFILLDHLVSMIMVGKSVVPGTTITLVLALPGYFLES
jgi:hypothetical protein